ncbi:hypothetical protein [Tropicibacter sp. S64]|uniref:hypothetical protein n=1 Tax=Tropicibacter sp. S64 TaxID=3415122 RepID=UPI003C7B0CFF
MTDWTRLALGAAVPGWAMAETKETPFPGTARPMPDTVDYRFVNGWVNTGDLPCREALKASLPARRIPCPDGPFPDLVLAGPDGEIDFSRFCHRPTLITRAFRCLIRGAPGVQARFRVATCGGVRLWLDGEPLAPFEPFTRNTPQSGAVTVTLSGETQTLTLRLEDLHERDTTCFFALVLESGDVETALPEGFDTDAVRDAGKVLAALRTDRLFHEPGDTIRLVTDVPPAASLPVRIHGPLPFGRGGLTLDPADTPVTDTHLGPQTPAIDLGPAGKRPPGCLSITVEITVSGARLRRQLGTTVLHPGTALGGTLSGRRAKARARIANAGGFDPSVALCLAAEGIDPERRDRIISAALDTIEARWDCSDFSILPLLRLFRDYRDTLPETLAERMREAFLGYRYWLDEPGDDVMWFWSENHVLCFHTAQRVAGDLFPEETFANSGLTGREQAARATARLHRWFDAIDRDGLCEWNSAAYYPIDLLGLLTLHDMAPDLRPRAKSVLDPIFVMAALHTTGRVPAGSQGRCYEKELLAGPHTELGSVMALALDLPFSTGYDRATGLLCLSDYAPPERLAQLSAPPEGQTLRASYTQGHDHAGRLTLWKSAAAQLSTVRPHYPGSKGHQAQVIDVQLACHPLARLWINHPGEARAWGERRPSLLAGSHVTPAAIQDGPTALMVFDVDRPWTALPCAQLFAAPEAFGTPARAGDWHVFADQVGVWCSTPLVCEAEGFFGGALWRAHAAQTGWCVTLRLPEESAEAFARRLSTTIPVFDGTALSLDACGLTLDASGSATKNGSPLPFAPLSSVPQVAWNDHPLQPWDITP